MRFVSFVFVRVIFGSTFDQWMINTERAEDVHREGPNLYDNRENVMLPSGSMLILNFLLWHTSTSTIWDVSQHPNLLVKYQIYFPDESVIIHPLSREYYYMKRIQNLHISPKVIHLSGPTNLDNFENVPHKFAFRLSNTEREECRGQPVRFMLIKKIDGPSLSELWRHSISMKTIVQIGQQMITVLQKLHTVGGIQHGDVHSGNWVIDRNAGRLFLIDFGMAQLIRQTHIPDPLEPFKNHVLFSPWEQAGYSPEPRDDVYRAVFILAEFVVGHTRLVEWFAGKSGPAAIEAKLTVDLFNVGQPAPTIIGTVATNVLGLVFPTQPPPVAPQWTRIMRIVQEMQPNTPPPYEEILTELVSIYQSIV